MTRFFNLSENSPPLFKAGMRANSRNEISGQRLAPTALETVSSPPVKAGESNKIMKKSTLVFLGIVSYFSLTLPLWMTKMAGGKMTGEDNGEKRD